MPSPLLRHPLRLLALLGCVLLFTLVLLPAGRAWAQEEPEIRYERYDAEIRVGRDGSFTVREIQQVRFNGEFSTAFAEIPLDYTEEITVLRVGEPGRDYEEAAFSLFGAGYYLAQQEGDALRVEWQYAPTAPGDVRIFIVEYRVEGGLWVYPDETVLEWRAVPADRSGFTADRSRVTVILPESVPTDTLHYTAYGPAFTAQATARSVRFEATEPLLDGVAFQVQVGFPPTLTRAVEQPWQSAEEGARLAYDYPALDVEMWVNADGTVRVAEQQHLTVTQGIMREGSRWINLAYLDSISEVELVEGEQPFEEAYGDCDYCFEASTLSPRSGWIRFDRATERVRISENQAGQAELRWHFPDLVRGEATTFRLGYTVSGLIVPEADGQRFDWAVVPSESRAPDTATLRLHLPPGIAPDTVAVRGGTTKSQADGTLLVLPDVPPSQHLPWEVSVTLPPGATSAAKPSWQGQLEAAQAEARAVVTNRTRVRYGAGVGGVILLVGGLLGTGLAWYTAGRDRRVPLVADFLSEPPSDLPPAVVAYLLDEEPGSKGVLASFFHLATLGLLRVSLKHSIEFQRNLNDTALEEGQMVETPGGAIVPIPPHLVLLYNRVASLIPTDKTVTMGWLAERLPSTLPSVYRALGEEAGRFFAGLPGDVRHRWLKWGQWAILASLALGVCAALTLQGEYGRSVLVPPVALAVVGVALALMSRWMPRRTDMGAEAAAQWQAFRRFLLNLKQYGSQEEAQRVLDQHFAYAVALGVEEVVLQQAEALGTHEPAWMQPVPMQREGYHPTNEDLSPRSGSRTVRHARDFPLRRQPTSEPSTEPTPRRSLQGLSNDLATSLNNADTTLASFLNGAADSVREATPFEILGEGTTSAVRGTFEVLGDILDASITAEGGGGYSGGSSSSSSRSSWSSSSSRSSSRSSGRSSSSRRSGGGGSRGFG